MSVQELKSRKNSFGIENWGKFNFVTQVHLWSSNFLDARPGGNKQFEELYYSDRIKQTERGETVQVLDSFDSKNYALAYHITRGISGIAKTASGVWSQEALEDNATRVTIAFDMEVKNMVGYLLSPMIKLKIGKSSEEIAEDLQYYVGNGEPHPRKISAEEIKVWGIHEYSLQEKITIPFSIYVLVANLTP